MNAMLDKMINWLIINWNIQQTVVCNARVSEWHRYVVLIGIECGIQTKK